jgi:hypothetical protein
LSLKALLAPKGADGQCVGLIWPIGHIGRIGRRPRKGCETTRNQTRERPRQGEVSVFYVDRQWIPIAWAADARAERPYLAGDFVAV